MLTIIAVPNRLLFYVPELAASMETKQLLSSPLSLHNKILRTHYNSKQYSGKYQHGAGFPLQACLLAQKQELAYSNHLQRKRIDGPLLRAW